MILSGILKIMLRRIRASGQRQDPKVRALPAWKQGNLQADFAYLFSVWRSTAVAPPTKTRATPHRQGQRRTGVSPRGAGWRDRRELPRKRRWRSLSSVGASCPSLYNLIRSQLGRNSIVHVGDGRYPTVYARREPAPALPNYPSAKVRNDVRVYRDANAPNSTPSSRGITQAVRSVATGGDGELCLLPAGLGAPSPIQLYKDVWKPTAERTRKWA